MRNGAMQGWVRSMGNVEVTARVGKNNSIDFVCFTPSYRELAGERREFRKEEIAGDIEDQ